MLTRHSKGGIDAQLGAKVTSTTDDEVGTVIDLAPRGYRVMWRSGEETVEDPEDLELAEHLMGWDTRPAYQEGPGGR